MQHTDAGKPRAAIIGAWSKGWQKEGRKLKDTMINWGVWGWVRVRVGVGVPDAVDQRLNVQLRARGVARLACDTHLEKRRVREWDECGWDRSGWDGVSVGPCRYM